MAASLKYATKRNSPNHDFWHMIEDIWRIRGNRIRIFKVTSAHALEDADRDASRSHADAIRRLGNLAADAAAKLIHMARRLYGGFDDKNIQKWCDQDKKSFLAHTKIFNYMAAIGLHVIGAPLRHGSSQANAAQAGVLWTSKLRGPWAPAKQRNTK